MINQQLWTQIQNFEFDLPTDVYGFSLRLAKENAWTVNFTRQAITEYKKFMYLAAVSDAMVSPSPVIDEVWHLHLIYTRSYDELCGILRKKIQHVPATHNPEEGRRYVDARERTMQLYRQEFGTAPAAIWDTSSMLDYLQLPKAKYKLRAGTIAGLIIIGAVAIPLYFLLKPVYVQISPGNFFTAYLMLTVISFLILQSINRSALNKIFSGFRTDSFLHRLTPSEVMYLGERRLEPVINGFLNKQIKDKHISISKDILTPEKTYTVHSAEEMQIMEYLNSQNKCSYSYLVGKFRERAIFANVKTSMTQVIKYIEKSKVFHRLFFVNMGVLSLLFLLGLERIATGVSRGKPVGYIATVVILIFLISLYQLYNIRRIIFTKTIPGHYEKRIQGDPTMRAEWQWQYFVTGATWLIPSLLAVAQLSATERLIASNPSRGSNGGGSCGSSCGSSCGGGGGCGGGGCGGCGS